MWREATVRSQNGEKQVKTTRVRTVFALQNASGCGEFTKALRADSFGLLVDVHTELHLAKSQRSGKHGAFAGVGRLKGTCIDVFHAAGATPVMTWSHCS